MIVSAVQTFCNHDELAFNLLDVVNITCDASIECSVYFTLWVFELFDLVYLGLVMSVVARFYPGGVAKLNHDGSLMRLTQTWLRLLLRAGRRSWK